MNVLILLYYNVIQLVYYPIRWHNRFIYVSPQPIPLIELFRLICSVFDIRDTLASIIESILG